MRLLVGGVLLQHLLPEASRAQHREAAFAQPRSRTLSPLFISVVGEQIAAVGGVVAALEALDIRDHLGIRRERDHTAAHDDRVALPQRPARVARRLVQVRSPGIGGQPRPEHLDHLVACQAMSVGEREHLDKVRRSLLRPGRIEHRP